MDHPLLLLFGMIVISTLLFALTRSLCRDPELLHEEVERERQRALTEAVSRHMDSHDLVAIASGRLGAGGLLASRRGRTSERSDGERSAGISQETRSSFIKLSAGRRGYAPCHDLASSSPAVMTLVESDFNDEVKTRQASISGERWDAKSPVIAERTHPATVVPSALADSACVSSRPRSVRRFLITGVGVPPGDATLADGGGAYSDNSCSVCLDEYEEGDELLQLTCGHVFHRNCIDLWLKGHRVCPCCRTDLDKLAQVAQVFPTTSRRSLQKALNRANGNAVIAVELLLTRRDRRNERSGGSAAADADVGGSGLVLSDGETVAPVEAPDACRGGGRGRGGGGGNERSMISSLSSRFRRSDSGMLGSIGNRSRSRSYSSGRGSRAPTPRNTNNAADSEEAVLPMDGEVAEVQVAVDSIDLELGGGGFRAGEAGAAAGAAAAATAAAVVAGTNETSVSRPSSGDSLGGMAGAWARRRRTASDAAVDDGSTRGEGVGVLASPARCRSVDFLMPIGPREESAEDLSRPVIDADAIEMAPTLATSSISSAESTPIRADSSHWPSPFPRMRRSESRSSGTPVSPSRTSSFSRVQAPEAYPPSEESGLAGGPSSDADEVVRAALVRAEEESPVTPANSSVSPVAPRTASGGGWRSWTASEAVVQTAPEVQVPVSISTTVPEAGERRWFGRGSAV